MQYLLLPLYYLTKGACMGKEYIIKQEYFDELLNTSSRNLVGKIMKRFELSSNLSDIKSQTKELVYENAREIKSLIEAHQHGWEQSTWKFVPKKEGN